ncbi:MAG: tyrosine-type recombinase/integrase [Terracidiphilus sp.]|jgi:site-specific recombinase XerD
MKLTVAYLPLLPASASPYRLLDEQGRQIEWANRFLDAKRLLQRSPCSLRAYAFDLLHFARWLVSVDPPHPLAELSESLLQDYIRHQLDQQPPPNPRTINHRLGVVRCLYRFLYERELPGQERFSHAYTTRSPLGYGRRRRMIVQGQRLTEPHRLIVPLSTTEVAQFWKSFRTYRDLALVGLMLQDGLRSCEVLSLQMEDLRLAERQLRVLGKGRKERLLPLPEDLRDVLQKYLLLERPLTNSPALFVGLKGPSRGRALSAAGLRSLFRHHRRASQVSPANPHRFRHTFGADMVRAGVSLPALQHLMGHAQIRTTMLYVQLAPQDVWREYHSAVEKRARYQTTL